MQIRSEKEWNGFWSLSTVAFILAWLYVTVYAVFVLLSALQPPGIGTWDISDYLFLSMFFVPVVLIPIFLIRSFRKKRHLRFGKILPWVFRVMYISIIFALCDSWWATTHRGTIFSRTEWKMKDGGTKGYIGFGYQLTYFRRIGGSHYGPEVWFWFTPFVVDLGHKHAQLCWVWNSMADD